MILYKFSSYYDHMWFKPLAWLKIKISLQIVLICKKVYNRKETVIDDILAFTIATNLKNDDNELQFVDKLDWCIIFLNGKKKYF